MIHLRDKNRMENADKYHMLVATIQGITDPISGISTKLQSALTKSLEDKALSESEAFNLIECPVQALPKLCAAASIVRDRGKGRTITFSPKVFIPLTRLCRDFCGYCTFRQSPKEADRLYMTPDEILQVAKAGQDMGCTEALFTLGERPEQRYPEAKEWLAHKNFRTTVEYLRSASLLVLQDTSLLPHGNPGTMSRREFQALKDVNASMGIMLESVSQSLCLPGGAHELAPSKWPRVRMKSLELAGILRIPFTTGILIGIGETREDRIESILAIREIHRRYGHIQEVIIQNFRAKPDTPMGARTDPDRDDILWTVAAARLILGPSTNIQVPPNLSALDYPIYLLAGINDWGGVSPVTIDYVNPEAPWPQLAELNTNTRDLGFVLRPRLPVYPEYIVDNDEYLPEQLKSRIKAMATKDGYVKGGIENYVDIN